MFYFPLFAFDWPEWVPLIGGNHFEFFNAIFNVADSAITIGVIWLIIEFLFPQNKQEKADNSKKSLS
jgi:signal peptidase II